jgi:large subunit ribosomal protein L31e
MVEENTQSQKDEKKDINQLSMKGATNQGQEKPTNEIPKSTNPQVQNDPKPKSISVQDKKPKTQTLERTYVIPLKREYLKVPKYKRTSRAIKTIKKFIAKHMKVSDRDFSKIKLDPYFNNYIWKQGKKSPPNKIKIKALKSEGIVTVNFVEIPEQVKFTKTKNEKRHKKQEIKKAPVKTEAEPQKTPEEQKEEKEKQQSVAESKEKIAEKAAKAEKHTGKVSKDKSSTKQRQVLSRH